VRAHEESTEKTDAPAAKRSPSAGTAATERILALQRAIGNDAVSGLIEQPGAAVHSVLSAGGRPLDEPLRRDMESRLGADFSSVRLHTGLDAQRSAREIGARAYTSGDHVVIGGGGADPHTLAHELTHVIQQRQGPVDGVDTGSGLAVSQPDDRFEQAAEENARRVMRTGTAPVDSSPVDPGVSTPLPTVQRRLKLGDVDLTASLNDGRQQAEEVWTQVREIASARDRDADRLAQMESQFWKWVAAQPGALAEGSHPVWGRKAQNRIYDNVDDLELALNGWVAAKPERHQEKVFAEQIKNSPEVGVRLNSVLHRIRKMIDELEDSDDADVRDRKEAILQQLAKVEHTGMTVGGATVTDRALGWYDHNLEVRARERGDEDILTNIGQGILHVLENPEAYEFRDKVVVIHDLMEYFGDQRPYNPTSEGAGLLPAPRRRDSKTTEDIQDGTRVTTLARGRRTEAGHQGTRDEQAPSTRFARARNIPVWSGSSTTTVSMLVLARWVNATRDEMTSLAHSVFAFWRLQYDHTSLAPHTLHEVMDMAQNFGVAYDPDNRYAGLGHQDVAAEQAVLRADMMSQWNALNERITAYADYPEFGALRDQWHRAGLQTFLQNSFDAVAEADRTRMLTGALRFMAAFDRQLNNLERNLESTSSEEE